MLISSGLIEALKQFHTKSPKSLTTNLVIVLNCVVPNNWNKTPALDSCNRRAKLIAPPGIEKSTIWWNFLRRRLHFCRASSSAFQTFQRQLYTANEIIRRRSPRAHTQNTN
jgi:hypothetical protein